MKNKRIRFDDRLYWTFFSLIISLVSLILLVTMYDIIPWWGLVILSVLFSLFLSGVFIFPKTGVLIDYKKGLIKYFGYIKINPSVIKMKDIQKIAFIEIPKERKKLFLDYSKTSTNHGGLLNEPEYVFRNGKIFKFIIELKDGRSITIPYFNLFKTRSKKRVYNQERFIKHAIEEINRTIPFL